MPLFLSLLKCSLTAVALFGFGMTAAATASWLHGCPAYAWTLLALPGPFGVGLALLSLATAKAAANAELN
jgi:hypothetical protein